MLMDMCNFIFNFPGNQNSNPIRLAATTTSTQILIGQTAVTTSGSRGRGGWRVPVPPPVFNFNTFIDWFQTEITVWGWDAHTRAGPNSLWLALCFAAVHGAAAAGMLVRWMGVELPRMRLISSNFNPLRAWPIPMAARILLNLVAFFIAKPICTPPPHRFG